MRRPFFAAAPLAVLLTGVALWQTTPTAADVTFTRDVAPILNAKCVTCHRAGEVAPMSLRTFEEVRPFARAIKDKVASRQMPPWFADRSAGHFSNDPSLTDKEIATIAAWVDAGAPQGNPADQPSSPKFTEGWQLGEPDYIVELPEVQIPATGGDYFPTPNLTLDLKEDRWIRALEIRPSNREVTHHSVIFSANVGGMMLGGSSGLFDVLGVWAVGTEPTVYPEGTGRWLHKGEMLRTNLHYHPNGTPQVDRTRIGFYFGKGDLKKEVAAALTGNMTFSIPAGAANHEIRGVYAVDQDIDVVSLFPHMHLRGKDMKMTANYPDGRSETLINVPAYDFNWQLFYYPQNRIRLPRGTRIELVAHYDNSAANKRNPDPTKPVTFGEASTNEMMFGMFEFTAADGVSPKPSTDRTRMQALVKSFPTDSAFTVDLPFGARPTRFALHIPRGPKEGGNGAWYVPSQFGTFTTMAVQDVKWQGREFSFVTLILIGGQNGAGRGYYDATGTLADDGTIHGRLTPKGPGTTTAWEFTGTANAE
jgi:hypothetical protein